MRVLGGIAYSLSCLVLVIASGCTTIQLRNDTICQMETVHELQQQQVLDNLAMFVNNRNSYPYYSTVNGGLCSLTDGGNIGITNGFSRTGMEFLYSSLGINPSVSRSLQENWQITPVNDSLKLTLMRCVYQKAVAESFCEEDCSQCPNCKELFDAFYGALLPPVIESIYALPPWSKFEPNKPMIIWGEHLQGAKVLIGGVPAFPPKAGSVVTMSTSSAESHPIAPSPAPTTELVPTPNPSVSSSGSTAIEVPASDDTQIVVVAPARLAQDPADLTVITAAGQTTRKRAISFGASVAYQSTAATPSQASGGPTPHSIGMVSPYCVKFSQRWFGWGPKSDIPNNCPPTFVGHYGDTYVWIQPKHVDDLTKLTILIQDIAYYDFSRNGVVGRSVSSQYPSLLLTSATLNNFTPTPAPATH